LLVEEKEVAWRGSPAIFIGYDDAKGGSR
jgi:hypothetical protein